MTTTRPVEAAQLKPARRAKTVVRRAKKNTKPAWIEQFVENYSFRDRHALASNPAIGECVEMVEKLSTDEDAYVRWSLASNPAIGAFPEIAAKLSSDRDPFVRMALNNNPAIPPRVTSTQQRQPWPDTQKAPSP